MEELTIDGQAGEEMVEMMDHQTDFSFIEKMMWPLINRDLFTEICNDIKYGADR